VTDFAEGPRIRRRARRSDRVAPGSGADAEELAVLHAELVLLREENARLRGAQDQRHDLLHLLGRARALPAVAPDAEGLGDDAAQLLIDGLVIRESLLEICAEIERAMVAFTARLHALASPAVDAFYPNPNATPAPGGHEPDAA
jgi:hypothetical protein